MRAWKHPEVSASGPSGERAWLITVTRNVAIDVFRAQRARRTRSAATRSRP